MGFLLHIKGKKATWTNAHTKYSYTEKSFTAASIINLIKWRLKNQYVKVGNLVVKQVLGTGQGDNHSGHLCRLISIAYERRFALYWASKNIKTAKQFNHTMRKHDDYAFLNNPDILPYLYANGNIPGIMPKYFTAVLVSYLDPLLIEKV